ncbi:hypothetical protein JHD50_06505 [Sulfurimonas sp. MAG313]|nr:hypothetical protein [Sulfurimonas sp. MAG313]MDF1880956.1 hypothetical protein [Sulfurimonas sp. MAG313]
MILLFLLAGINHFSNPNFYVSIMPPYLPLQSELAYIAGVLEISGAFGLLFAKTRRIAGYSLLALLVLIFPANIHMALHPEYFSHYSPLTIYLRLPIQFIFIAWVYWAAIRKKARGDYEL